MYVRSKINNTKTKIEIHCVKKYFDFVILYLKSDK